MIMDGMEESGLMIDGTATIKVIGVGGGGTNDKLYYYQKLHLKFKSEKKLLEDLEQELTLTLVLKQLKKAKTKLQKLYVEQTWYLLQPEWVVEQVQVQHQ